MTKKSESEIVQSYEPTPCETSFVASFHDKASQKPPAPELKIETKNDVNEIDIDHPDQTVGLVMLMEAIGTTDLNFLNGLLAQLVDASSKCGEVNMEEFNFMLSVVKGVEPKDHLEAMMAAQMAAVHMKTMKFARSLGQVENVAQQDSAERALNKLARTYTTQMAALKKYRTGSVQKVIVEHVTVNEGGQAIVGNFETGGVGYGKK
jgi:hypothetical protein